VGELDLGIFPDICELTYASDNRAFSFRRSPGYPFSDTCAPPSYGEEEKKKRLNPKPEASSLFSNSIPIPSDLPEKIR
jgi:hypothetical protein